VPNKLSGSESLATIFSIFPSSNEEEVRAHVDLTRFLRRDDRSYFYMKDYNLFIDEGGAKPSPFKSSISGKMIHHPKISDTLRSTISIAAS